MLDEISNLLWYICLIEWRVHLPVRIHCSLVCVCLCVLRCGLPRLIYVRRTTVFATFIVGLVKLFSGRHKCTDRHIYTQREERCTNVTIVRNYTHTQAVVEKRSILPVLFSGSRLSYFSGFYQQ